MSEALIECNNVSYRYPGGSSVLEGINLRINRNELLILKGESGAGKSTFLKLFNRFCEIDGGSIFYDGKDYYEYRVDELRASAIYFPQQPVIIEGSVEENLSFPFSFKSHKHKKYDRDKALAWLRHFNLELSPDHEAMKLSVGQMQRLALVRTILLEPRILLLDEPCSALDPNNKELIERKIEELTSTTDMTVMMATHGQVGFSRDRYRLLALEGKEVVECTVG